MDFLAGVDVEEPGEVLRHIVNCCAEQFYSYFYFSYTAIDQPPTVPPTPKHITHKYHLVVVDILVLLQIVKVKFIIVTMVCNYIFTVTTKHIYT